MTDTTYLILTVIGDDRPGLVGELSATISAHQGNWLESSMSHLAGKFAGIVRVAVPREKVTVLKAALAAMPQLKVTAETSAGEVLPPRVRHLTLSLVGHDRIGIVKEVSQVLANHGVNVEELETHIASAPMSAETLFHANAKLMAGEDLDARELKADLEFISNDLMVDITLGEIV
jgi:glycine cleavage system regulatory protein